MRVDPEVRSHLFRDRAVRPKTHRSEVFGRVMAAGSSLQRYAGSVEWDPPEDRYSIIDYCYVERASLNRRYLLDGRRLDRAPLG